MTDESPTGGSAAKQVIRKAVLAGRNALSAAAQAAAADALARHAPRFLLTSDATIIAGYWPWRSEMDPRPLMLALHAAGRRIALPIIEHPRMIFRIWEPEAPLVDAGFGTLGPSPDAPVVRPDALLVPLAVFTRAGDRIGWGKGHYDRAITGLWPVSTFGIAHALQEIAEAPVEDHDRPLDAVLTDREWIDCKGARGD
jgi:5-formyltetrahydrofolate cyclo-ligase